MSEPYERWNPTRRNRLEIMREKVTLNPCEAPGCKVSAKCTVRLENGELCDMCIRHFLEFGDTFRAEECDELSVADQKTIDREERLWK